MSELSAREEKQNENEKQPLADRNQNRTRRNYPEAFKAFIGSGWAPRTDPDPEPSGAANYLAARHLQLGSQFKGERLVIPAGNYKVRSNDTDYRFRAHTAFIHLSGLGGEHEPDAVVVLDPIMNADGKCFRTGKQLPDDHPTHSATIFFRPQAPRSSEEFYGDSTYGEFWVGPRLTIPQMEILTGLKARPLDELADALAKDLGPGPKEVQMRVIRGIDQQVEGTINLLRSQAELPFGDQAKDFDEKLEEVCSTIRFCKDQYEIEQLELAVQVTKEGFEEIIRSLPRAQKHHRGERVLEGAFMARAREDGNGLGYDTISAGGNHANTLHWIDNDGPILPGQMVLVDAGVEVDSLYTADITRTLPVNGHFSPRQAQVYQAVLDACEAGLAAARKPGCRFQDIHDASVKILVDYLDDWGLLPCSKEEALGPDGQQFRRWMPHGVSHHLGLDVHDCAQASLEMYQYALLEPGMCFTIEPGLYFHKDDLLIPEDFRGIGVRIEDDVIVDLDGTVRRLSENIPRTIADVEAWIAQVQSR